MFADMPENQRPTNPAELVMKARIDILSNSLYLSDSWGILKLIIVIVIFVLILINMIKLK